MLMWCKVIVRVYIINLGTNNIFAKMCARKPDFCSKYIEGYLKPRKFTISEILIGTKATHQVNCLCHDREK